MPKKVYNINRPIMIHVKTQISADNIGRSPIPTTSAVNGSHWLCMGRSQNGLLVRPFCRLRCLCQKVENFSGSNGSVGQSDCGYANTLHATTGSILLDPGPTGSSNKQEEAGNIRLLCFFKECGIDRIVFSHLLFVSSSVFISTHRLCYWEAIWLAAGFIYKD